jgi:SAM-dependent methyltransferase
LAEQLLADHPTITYTGIDITAPLLDLARARLTDHATRTQWIKADLNEDEWLVQIAKPVQIFVSLQSLHDLGDEAAVARIMRLAAQELAPQGRFVYADMLPPAPPEENTNPGKLPIVRHRELLRAAGFATVECTLQRGVLGCFVAQL